MMFIFYFIVKIFKWILTRIFGERDTNEQNATLLSVGFLIVLVLFAFGFVMNQCSACRNAKNEKRSEELDDRINQTKGEANILTEQKKGLEENANKSAEMANQANVNFNSVHSTDSSTRNGNFRATKSKFCTEFPTDSKCRR